MCGVSFVSVPEEEQPGARAIGNRVVLDEVSFIVGDIDVIVLVGNGLHEGTHTEGVACHEVVLAAGAPPSRRPANVARMQIVANVKCCAERERECRGPSRLILRPCRPVGAVPM